MNSAVKNGEQQADNKSKYVNQMEDKVSVFELKDADQNLECPDVVLVDELSELHQFRDMEEFNNTDKIASVYLKKIEHKCHSQNGSLAVEIAMKFKAVLGPRSRIFNRDEPTISYPYFLAVTDKYGQILDKEIHGISLSFQSDQSKKTHIEQISKILRSERLDGEHPYAVMVGFQLSPEELSYNQIMRGKLLAPEAGKKPRAALSIKGLKVRETDLTLPVGAPS